MKLSEDQKKLITVISDVLVTAVTLEVPVVTPLAIEGGHWCIEKYFDKRNEFSNTLLSLIKKELPENWSEYSYIVESSIIACLEGWDPITQEYNAEKAAKQLSNDFLNKYSNQYGDKDREILRSSLPSILCCVIERIEEEKERNPEFQVAWKNKIETSLGIVKTQSAETQQMVQQAWQTVQAIQSQTCNVVTDLSGRYRRNWTKPLFLERINGKRLCDVYLSPDCKIAEQPFSLAERLQDFLDGNDGFDMRVLLGHPGSGKSTAITWLLNQPDLIQNRKVRVYRFADFEDIDWTGRPNNLPSHILKDAGLKTSDLNNSILILDGLDEINMGEQQTKFLNALLDWENANNFRLIVTCRITRITELSKIESLCWEICPFDDSKIIQFSQIYDEGSKAADLSVLLTQDKSLVSVLGIPFILYMILALNIDLSEHSSLVTIYNQIFSLTSDKSIYLRQNYDDAHPVTKEEIKQIHCFSQKVAVSMWENAPQQAYLKKSEYEAIATSICEGTPDSRLHDILIGQYFMEGQENHELYFIHRSLYEYFVALSFLECMISVQKCGTVDSLFQTMHDRKPAPTLTALVDLLATNNITAYLDIKSFLFALMQNKKLTTSEFCFDPVWWQKFFEKSIEEGLSFASSRPSSGNIGIFEERIRLCNLLVITKFVLKLAGNSAPYSILKPKKIPMCFFVLFPYDYRKIPAEDHFSMSAALDLAELDLRKINISEVDLVDSNLADAILTENSLYRATLESAYLKRTNLAGADLTEAELRGAFLMEADLSEAVLNHACLYETSLGNADLCGATLIGANLSDADLTCANLVGADFSDADLSNAILTGADLADAELSGADLSHTNLSYANLSSAALTNADLTGADFTHACVENIKVGSFYYRGKKYPGSDFKKFLEKKDEFHHRIASE